ncbi:efflux RND transporter permease subunit [Rubritalea marina]|uniref:efflux RND transporter permease subunit n=1 Tax=Rubritalea marina TaxID=361055 RepID=UPI0003829CDB|nr:efflux RND transporter permease subunit [Rubritalea marina]
MIHWFAKNHIAANILMAAILLLGGYTAYFKLPVEVEPAVSFPKVVINVPLRGGTPRDVEQKVILPIESALVGIAGIERVESHANRNSGSVHLDISDDVDIKEVKAEIESKLESISTFPDEAENAKIYIPSTAYWFEVITVVVHGKLSNDELIAAARKVRDDLTSLNGISKVVIKGRLNKEIVIEIEPEVLNAYGFTMDTLSRAIREASLDLSAGSINNNGERILIRSSSQAYKPEQFRDIVISRSNGSELKLGDLADVNFANADDQKVLRFNNEDAIAIEVLRMDGENSLKIASAVHQYVNDSSDRFPTGVKLSTWDDDSVSLKSRLKLLSSNLIQGAVLVLLFLGLFLRPTIALWVVIGIPISFAGGIISMQYLGVSANNMSIFAFILVLGIVVDDAIVTAENIYSNIRSTDGSTLDAVVKGTKEVSTPVTFGMLTTIAAFTPLMFIDGYLGTMAKQIPLIVIPVLLFSLVESKLILPAHLKYLKTNRKGNNWLLRLQRSIADGFENVVQKLYRPSLDFCIRHRYSTLASFIAIFMLTAGWFVKSDNFNASPSTDRYYIFASLDMVNGTSYETTDQKVMDIVAALDSIRPDFVDPESGNSLILDTLTSSGGKPWRTNADPTEGYILVSITPPSQRSEPGPSNQEIASAWKDAVGEIQGARSFYIRTQRNSTRGRSADPVSVELRSNNDEERIAVTRELKDWLMQHDSIDNAWNNSDRTQREMIIKLNEHGREAGLSEQSLARQIRNAFFGTQVQKFMIGDAEQRVMLKLPKDMRSSTHTLETLKIPLPGSNQLADMSHFASIDEGSSPPRIERADGARLAWVRANPKDGFKTIKIEPELTETLNQLCLDYPSVTWRYKGELAEYKEGNQKLIALSIILVFTLYSLLAIPFKSIIQPFLVMIAVPFGVIGAYWGHVILGIDISFLSYFGMLALAGVVVNDSLVIVDFINNKRQQGMPIREAIAQAGIRRFRPIFLTSVTTFAGLMPIMFETSIEAQFMIPMAVSLGFGILFATVITLYLVPASYAISVDLTPSRRSDHKG